MNKTHYLPHRPVVKENRQTTKVRMVFDASCKGKSKQSLNDTLNSGPSLTPLLSDVLLRFHSFNYFTTGDLEKSFLQISISPEDRNFVRFIWFKDINNLDFDKFENNELIEYRSCRVLFGLTCSPFLLATTLRKDLNQYSNLDPEFVEQILQSLHVDDLISGTDTMADTKSFFEKSKTRLAAGGFHLRKFKSNSSELEIIIFKKFPYDLKYSTNFAKALGLKWDKSNDYIIFDFEDIKQHFPNILTKRLLIHSLATIFDPLGLITPVIVSMKELCQDICRETFTWDEIVPEKVQNRWQEILTLFGEIKEIKISRPYSLKSISNAVISVELHCFSDANKRNYASVIYSRFIYKLGNIKVPIVTSKLSKTV